MGAISIKGVVIGGIVDVVTSVVLGVPFALYAVSKLDLSNIPKDRVESAISAAIHAKPAQQNPNLVIKPLHQ
jgi:hypothetical protein